jgi:hypothetical protein
MRIEIAAEHPLGAGAGDHMPKVTDDGVDAKHLAVSVVIESPRVGHAVQNVLNYPPLGVVAPDTGVDFDALGIGRAGNANAARHQDTVASVEPTVRSPTEPVRNIVANVLSIEAIQDGYWRPVGNIITIRIRDKNEVGRREGPNAAKADLDAR